MPSVFLYGPDTLQPRVHDRVGKTELVGGAVLDGFGLEFNKPNMKQKDEGMPNVVESPGRSVFGVLHDLTAKQLEILDGYYGGYGRREVEVRLIGKDAELRKATLWFARRTKAGLRPTKSALEASQRGAKEHGAPEAFRQELQKVEPLDD